MPTSAPFNVNEFRSALGNGGVRPNQFQIIFNPPRVLQFDNTVARSMQLLVQAASLPASNIGETPVPFRGRMVYVAGERTFDPWTVTVLNDTNFTARSTFESWQNAIVRYRTVYGETNPSQYLADMAVQQLDRNNNVLMQYHMIDAFPVNISDIPLAYGDNDTISSFTCTFRYQSFTSSNYASTSAPADGLAAGATI